jgi:BON domain
MDPIRTAVKYALSPLRLIVQLGDEFVSHGEERRAPQPRAPQPRAPRPAARAPRKASRVPKDLDDVGLARKVETIIFRDDNVPKGHIDVNAANGVVWLRGQAKTPEMIKVLVRQCAAIPEVRQVENLLHLPKTPAPTRT